uniref:NADH-ubiquinone oxidoreductase chain 5 n=1 Tax=Ornithodoros moubata TaxID=6938 RepID=Q8HQJ7_ORNMO|nr:NADH dehydrogenase subunit 5 [Ornithodoros moubata]BAC22587.1 NADH dehydrogenase 5 [Ornithodoros moubata]
MFFQWGLLLVAISLCFLIKGFDFLLSLSVVVVEYNLFSSGNFEFKFFFLFDWMSVMFCSIVLLISGVVVIYSNDYMKEDKLKIYFCYGVLMFIGSMLIMIVSPNLMMILVGWDGLGFVSYVLVIFYQNYNSNSAGMMTVLSNRIGDVMILLSLVYMLNFGVLDFYKQNEFFALVGFMMIFVGMTKSAQIPFSAWLPMAMAAPTPVSALVHSSTLVTAGVYLLIRLSLLFQIEMFSKFLLYISLVTSLMAGVSAILETDLKKIIALSTLSQLGLMMTALSLGQEDLAFFHLLVHAVFKAMLFLCAGFMIHSSLGIQDIRFFGGLSNASPMVSVSFSVANMSLFGVPFLSGFYSSDFILEKIYEKNCNFFVILVMIVATICTCIYSLRVMYYIMWSEPGKLVVFYISWSNWMEVPIFFMGLVVLVFGSVFSWVLFPNYEVGLVFMNLSMINIAILLIGIWIFFVVYFDSVGKLSIKVNNFLSSMWFLSTFSGSLFLNIMFISGHLSKVDSSWVEEVGPQGIFKVKLLFVLVFQWIQVSSFKSLFTFFIVLLLLNF